jgi:hypothetical protein
MNIFSPKEKKRTYIFFLTDRIVYHFGRLGDDHRGKRRMQRLGYLPP